MSDDQIIISYSELIKWQVCKRQYYYRYPLNRVKEVQTAAVDTGVKGHRLLQTFYELLKQGVEKDKALEVVSKQVLQIMSKEKFMDKNVLSAWTLVDNYIKGNNFKANAFLVENRFLVPATKLIVKDDGIRNYQSQEELEFWDNILIGFTPDIVFERLGPRYDVEDSKFIQRAWPEQKINRFSQTKLYQIFLETMGYNVSRSTLRMFNVKTGHITQKNYVMTAVEKETLKHDFLIEVKELVEYKRQSELQQSFAPRTMNYTACQFCDYEFVCGLQAAGKDATKTLESMYVTSDYDYRS